MTKQQEHVLFELRTRAQAQLAFGDALDNKLNLLIGSAVVMFGLFSALGITRNFNDWYWFILFALALFYFVSVLVAARAFLPSDYHFPLMADWDHLANTYLSLSEDAMLDLVISQYIVAIEKNDEVLERKTFAVRVGMVMLFASLLILTGIQLIR